MVRGRGNLQFHEVHGHDHLSIEKTKVWHFSAKALSELYDDELNGHLVWPEEP